MDMGRFWNSKGPPLRGNAEYLQERVREIEEGVQGAGHGTAYLDYYRFQLQNIEQPAYYYRSTLMGSSVAPIEDLVAQGFCWAVVNDEAVRTQRSRAFAGDSTGLRYYASLEARARRVAEFRPERWKRRGPLLRVYALCRGPG
jgi:hypothetical protein